MVCKRHVPFQKYIYHLRLKSLIYTTYAVTLLALGNGAPDLVSSIAAVKAGKYHLALGGLLGKHPAVPLYDSPLEVVI